MTNAQIITRLKEILATHNPCGFKTVRTFVEKVGFKDEVTCHGGTPCCGGCRHLTDRGCSLKAAHACSFFFCRTAWAKMGLMLRMEIKVLGMLYTGKLYFRESVYSFKANHKQEGYSRHPSTMKTMMTTKPPFVW